mmetsp:Transcript_143751/g.460108  ORF Transcript_143751/g.460108 Transcript_143751/m.460108 type:complete len:215 (+) Transcript_143751:1695-2339(+)
MTEFDLVPGHREVDAVVLDCLLNHLPEAHTSFVGVVSTDDELGFAVATLEGDRVVPTSCIGSERVLGLRRGDSTARACGRVVPRRRLLIGCRGAPPPPNLTGALAVGNQDRDAVRREAHVAHQRPALPAEPRFDLPALGLALGAAGEGGGAGPKFEGAALVAGCLARVAMHDEVRYLSAGVLDLACVRGLLRRQELPHDGGAVGRACDEAVARC